MKVHILMIPLLLAACDGEIPPGLLGSGTLEAVETTISTPVAGQVAEVMASEGDTVAKDQVLMKLDTEPLTIKQRKARAGLAEVAANDALAKTRIRQAQEQLDAVNLRFERVTNLYKTKSASQQLMDDITTQKRLAEENLNSANEALAIVEAKRGQIQSNLDLLEWQIGESAIKAPVAGVVLDRYVDVGEWVGVGMPLAETGDIGHLKLRVYVPNRMTGQVQLGQKVKVIPDIEGGTALEGTVAWIASEAEFTPKNIQTKDARAELVYAVKIQVPNADGKLKIGTPAEAWLP